MKESKKTKSVAKLSLEQEQELEKTLKIIADGYSTKNTIIRGLTTGLFTAIGATFGFALVLYILTGLMGVPIVNQFMKLTGLDQVVDYVLEQENDIGVSDEGGTKSDYEILYENLERNQ